ncbi:MAG: hypothetical protein ACYC4Q_12205, partial [Victivallaceae bacterium]
LLKVQLSSDSLTFVPLNVEWFNKADNEKVKELKSVAYDGNDKLKIYANTPQEWEIFLENNMNNPEIFNEKQQISLKKISAIPDAATDKK